MFTMMNNARLNVGLQGVGLAERATQRAVAYALDRKQGQRNGIRDDRRPSRRAAHAGADAGADDGCARARPITRSGRPTVGRWEIARRVFAPTSSRRW